MDVYGNVYNKSVDYSFENQATKYGRGAGCVKLFKGLKYLPRDTSCDVPMQIICKWKGEFKNKVTSLPYGHHFRAQICQIFESTEFCRPRYFSWNKFYCLCTLLVFWY